MATHQEIASRPNPRVSAVDLAMLVTVIIWGVNAPIVKASIHGWDPLAYNAIRFAVAGLTTFLYVVRTDKHWRLDRKDFWHVALLGLVGNGLYQFLYVEAISRTTASNTSLITAMSPLVVTIWAGLARIDRITRWVVAGTLISVAGAILVILGKEGGLALSGKTLVGDILASGCMLSWGAYTVYAKPVITRVGSSLRVTGWAMLFGAISNAGLGLTALSRQDFGAITGLSWAGMAFSCLFSLVVGYVIYAWAVERVGGARTAIYLNLTPILAAFFAWWMIGESWTAWQWMGAALVVGGVTVAKMESLRG